ncbi:MAG: 4'-phosphopantetheinyl transferase superfamily protein [Bacteroidaceae bacterium]|nr:4'-phosphopantetheinyl transferase superfamily protein [Bacteroidaceae bacterium]
MVYIYNNIDSFSDEQLTESLDKLSEQRRESALKFKHELGRKQCVLAYLLLCKGLEKEYGIKEKPVFEYGEHGKPSIIGHANIHFNLSHCKTAVACAISNEPVGIDIESVRKAKEPLVKYCMNDAECETIFSAANPDMEFTKLWTQKESVFKLTGSGINDSLKEILNEAALKGIIVTTTQCEKYVYSVAKYDNDFEGK